MDKKIICLNLKSNSKFTLHGSRNKSFSFAALLFALLIIFCFVSMFSSTPSYVSAVPNVTVYNDADLELEVSDAPDGSSYVIALGAHVDLQRTLVILANKNITLTSVSGSTFNLIGANGFDVISVSSGGWLVLDGIVVCHNSGDTGRGVLVNSGGILNMTSGTITNNRINNGNGGGVNNAGIFTMSGGVIINNNATNSWGGGVFNSGSFIMSGDRLYERLCLWFTCWLVRPQLGQFDR
jgi:hypothetical protein